MGDRTKNWNHLLPCLHYNQRHHTIEINKNWQKRHTRFDIWLQQQCFICCRWLWITNATNTATYFQIHFIIIFIFIFKSINFHVSMNIFTWILLFYIFELSFTHTHFLLHASVNLFYLLFSFHILSNEHWFHFNLIFFYQLSPLSSQLKI